MPLNGMIIGRWHIQQSIRIIGTCWKVMSQMTPLPQPYPSTAAAIPVPDESFTRAITFSYVCVGAAVALQTTTLWKLFLTIPSCVLQPPLLSPMNPLSRPSPSLTIASAAAIAVPNIHFRQPSWAAATGYPLYITQRGHVGVRHDILCR